MKAIGEQINQFLSLASMSATRLAKESGVHDAYISRLRSGKQKDTMSRNTDALRDAMQRLDPSAAAIALAE